MKAEHGIEMAQACLISSSQVIACRITASVLLSEFAYGLLARERRQCSLGRFWGPNSSRRCWSQGRAHASFSTVLAGRVSRDVAKGTAVSWNLLV